MNADEDFAHNINDILLMGGNMEGIGNATVAAEFNFVADPEGAYVVLANVVKPILVVTWEMCYLYTNITKVKGLHTSTLLINCCGSRSQPPADFSSLFYPPILALEHLGKECVVCGTNSKPLAY